MANENDTKPVSFEDYLKSGYHDSSRVDQLKSELEKYSAGDDRLRAEAEAAYNPAYEAEREGLRQQLARQTQAYQSEIDAGEAAFDRQKRAVNQSYDDSAARLNNSLTARGLGRSSLVSTQGTALENSRNQALHDIEADRAAQIGSLNDKIALLTDQAAQSERTMASNYASQLEKRINDLRESNRTASTALQLQIAALQQQGYEAYQNWLLKQRAQALDEAEFREKYGLTENSTKQTASSSSGKKAQTAAKTAEKQSTGGLISGLVARLKNNAPARKSGSSVGNSGATVTKAAKSARMME